MHFNEMTLSQARNDLARTHTANAQDAAFARCVQIWQQCAALKLEASEHIMSAQILQKKAARLALELVTTDPHIRPEHRDLRWWQHIVSPVQTSEPEGAR